MPATTPSGTSSRSARFDRVQRGGVSPVAAPNPARPRPRTCRSRPRPAAAPAPVAPGLRRASQSSTTGRATTDADEQSRGSPAIRAIDGARAASPVLTERSRDRREHESTPTSWPPSDRVCRRRRSRAQRATRGAHRKRQHELDEERDPEAASRKPSVHSASELAHWRSAARTANPAAQSRIRERRQRARSSATSEAATSAQRARGPTAIRVPGSRRVRPEPPDGEAGSDDRGQEEHRIAEALRASEGATAVAERHSISAANAAADSRDFGMKPARSTGLDPAAVVLCLARGDEHDRRRCRALERRWRPRSRRDPGAGRRAERRPAPRAAAASASAASAASPATTYPARSSSSRATARNGCVVVDDQHALPTSHRRTPPARTSGFSLDLARIRWNPRARRGMIGARGHAPRRSCTSGPAHVQIRDRRRLHRPRRRRHDSALRDAARGGRLRRRGRWRPRCTSRATPARSSPRRVRSGSR